MMYKLHKILFFTIITITIITIITISISIIGSICLYQGNMYRAHCIN